MHYIAVLFLTLEYLHQAILLLSPVPAVVQEQPNTALLGHDGTDERWVQAQVPGYSLNWDLVSPQAYEVCLSSSPYGISCGVGKGRLTPLSKPLASPWSSCVKGVTQVFKKSHLHQIGQ